MNAHPGCASGLRVLVSALSCNPRIGSEALIGYKYAEALARRHQVTVLASPPAETPAGAVLYPVPAGPCNFNEVAPAPLMRFELRQFPRAWSLHRRQRFDVVHRVTPSHISNATLLPNLRASFVIGPLLAAEVPPQSFEAYLGRIARRSRMGRFHPRRLEAGLSARVLAWLARRHVHLRNAQRILVGTRVALDYVPAPWRDRCVYLPYSGVEHDYFVPPSSRSQTGPLQLLYVGRVIPYKGLELLLRALDRAVRRCDFHLRVVGGGHAEYTAFCRRLTTELDLQSRVEFLPAVPRAELRDLYQQADVFCFPTLCDTYGIALLEAMSCGCAVVVSDVAGPREIVAEGCGLKVPLRDPEQYIDTFADALITLARDPSLRGEVGQAAREHIVTHHDWDDIARSLLRIYEEL